MFKQKNTPFSEAPIIDEQSAAERMKWVESVLCAIHNEKLRIYSTLFLGTNIQYEYWIEIRAKVFNNRTVNDEVADLNGKISERLRL